MPANCMPGNLGGFDVMYERKTWKNRETEFPGRRRMTAVDGQEDVFDVSREEGLILEEGDAFDADTMNNMEQRVEEGFSNTCQYLYKATFDMDSWAPGSGNVTQTATLVPVDGGPPVTSGSTLLACEGTDSTLPQDTKDAMSGPAGEIAKASKTLGDNSITVTLDSAPDVDVEIYFSIKQGVEPSVPPLDQVGAGGAHNIDRTAKQTFKSSTTFTPEKDGIFVTVSGEGLVTVHIDSAANDNYWLAAGRATSGWTSATAPAFKGTSYVISVAGKDGFVMYYPYK